MTNSTCDHCKKPLSGKAKMYCGRSCKNAALYQRYKALGLNGKPKKNKSLRKTGTVKFPTVEERNRRVKFCG